jgi:ATP-binding cassette subfamily B protein
MADIANSCFEYLHNHSVTFFNNNFVGSLVKRVNRFSRAFEGIADIIEWEFVPIFVNLTIITIVLTKINPLLGIAILVWVFVYLLINYALSVYKLKYDIQKSVVDSEVTAVLADTITNQANVKLFTGYKRETNYFARVNEKLRGMRKLTWNLDSIFEALTGFLMISLEVGIMYFAIILWDKGLLTVGDFVLIQAYIFTLFGRLFNVGRIVRRFYEHLAEADEMTEILETPHEIIDSHDARSLKVVKGEIEFKDVGFSYRKTRSILSRFNLLISPNERIALVGPSGSGKSTIVNLLLRNYDLERGMILIDGQRVVKTTQESLRKNIGVVSQDTILFHRTLKENIRYGKPSATDAEVMRASKLAHSHEFIKNFPEGYSTFVGERGVKLSGGERQRVAIARAILKDSPILILDEATSSLDSQSEDLIQKALETLMKNKTVIVIAHRLSTIMKMDRIIVLHNGKIEEEGSHTSLTRKRKGLYKSLWQKQAGGFLD